MSKKGHVSSSNHFFGSETPPLKPEGYGYTSLLLSKDRTSKMQQDFPLPSTHPESSRATMSDYYDITPCPANYSIDRVADRIMDELLGICRGVLADGDVNQDRIWGRVKR